MRPGLWVRAGQTAVITGLDWRALEALVPANVDRERVLELLAQFELGMLAGTEAARAAEAAEAEAKAEMERGGGG